MKRNTVFMPDEANQVVMNVNRHKVRKNRTFVDPISSALQLKTIREEQYNAKSQFQTKTIVQLFIDDLMEGLYKILQEKERQQIIRNAAESCNQLFHTQNWALNPTTPNIRKSKHESLVPDQQPQKKKLHPLLGFEKIIRQKKIEKLTTQADSRKNSSRTKKSSSKMLSIKSNRSSILSTFRGQATDQSSFFLSKLVPLNLNVDSALQTNQIRRIQDILRDKKNIIQGNNNFAHSKGRVFFTSVDEKDKESLNLNSTARQIQKFNEQSRTSRGYAVNLTNTTSSKLAPIRTTIHTSRQEYNYDENGEALSIIKRQNKIKNTIKVVKTSYNILNSNENDKNNIRKVPKRQILNVKLKPVKRFSGVKHNDIALGDLKCINELDELKTGLLSHFLKQRVHFRQLDQNQIQAQKLQTAK